MIGRTVGHYKVTEQIGAASMGVVYKARELGAGAGGHLPFFFTMSLDGQNLIDLTNNPSSDFGPAWAADQTWLAFTSDRTGNRDVYILKPGLPDLYNVTNSPGSQDQVTDWR